MKAMENAAELRRKGFEKIDADLAFVMDCLREALDDMGMRGLARRVPWISPEAPRRRVPDDLPQLYSIAFQILNLVEENAAAYIRRRRESAFGLQAETGLWGSGLQALKQGGVGERQVAEAMPGVRVEPVLTAHPTEAKRTSVLEQHRHLYALLQKRDNELLTHSEQRALRRRIIACIERLWRTGETLLVKPEVSTERDAMLHYLRDVFPAVIPEVDIRLQEAWEDAGWSLKRLSEPSAYPKIRFGSWVGGDRDGHPLVTAEVTRETLAELRLNALLVLHKALKRLRDRLTLSRHLQPVPGALLQRIAEIKRELGGDIPQDLLAGGTEEPWRDLVRLMKAKLPLDLRYPSNARIAESPASYRRVGELERDLHLIRDTLMEIGAKRIVYNDVHPVLRLVDTFGFHLAALDIRQNSAFHEKALCQLMNAAGLDGAGFACWSEVERLAFLVRELESPRPFAQRGMSCGAEADAVMACYRVLDEQIEACGVDGIGSLIVSMTRSVSDLLIVYVLAREAGLVEISPDGLACKLPVVPLFETIDDLDAAPGILERFLDFPMTLRSLELQESIKRKSYRGSLKRSVRHSGLVQQVMIGYSDSNKDSGIFASQWALQRAQDKLHEIGGGRGVAIRFFHGRGGTVSRGAGPTHRFLEALPNATSGGDVRLTEQGETVAQKYNYRSTAAYHVELLVAGVATTSIADRFAACDEPDFGDALDRVSAWSREAYRGFLEMDGFMEFYGEATPIDALEISGIGSRPARRTGRRALSDLRAIPWVFSWTQSRFYLPGWFGIGTGFATLQNEDPGEFKRIARRLRDKPFLNYLLTNVATSLASASTEFMRAYAGLVGDRNVRDRVLERIEVEFALTARMLEELHGSGYLKRRPRMLKTLHLREDALDTLHHHQIALLRQWRGLLNEGRNKEADALRPRLLLSINAIASGLRTTG